MALAALLISVAAALAASVAAGYTRRYANIEQDRRHDEQRPALRAVLDRLDDRLGSAMQRCQLLLYSDGPTDLETVHLEILDSGGLVFFVDAREHGQRADGGPLPTGGTLFWPVNVSATRIPIIRLKVLCQAISHKPWTVVVTVELPEPLKPGVTDNVW